MNLDELRAVQDREREKDSLQHLRDSFYEEVGTYIADLRSERERRAEQAEDPFADPEVRRLTDEIETAEEVAESIYERRMGKVVKTASLAAAGYAADTEGLTGEEAALFDDLVERIEGNKETVLDVLSGTASSRDDGGAPVVADDAAADGAPTAGSDGASVTGGEAAADAAAAAGGSGTAPGESAVGAEDPELPDDAAEGAGDDAAATGAHAAMGGELGVDDEERGGAAPADDAAASDRAAPAPDAPSAGDPPAPDDVPPGAEGAPPVDGESDAASESSGASVPDDAEASDAAAGFDGVDPADADRVTVRITDDVGEIVGVDGTAYDLATDTVVTLPEENAKPLLEKDAAVRVD